MDKLKIVIYIKDVVKPIVLTCSPQESSNKQNTVDYIQRFLRGDSDSLKFDSGDILLCDPSNVRGVVITTDK